MTSNGGQSILEPIRRPDAHASAPGPPPARRELSAGAGSPARGAAVGGPEGPGEPRAGWAGGGPPAGPDPRVPERAPLLRLRRASALSRAAGRARGRPARSGRGPPAAAPPHGQAVVILTTRASLGAVALAVGGALRRHGIPAVLTGGACASLHTRGAYQSRDMDFILVGATTQARLDTAMASVGFSVEFPRGPLAIGSDYRIAPVERRGRHGRALILSATDSCRDRLAAFYHWNDRSSLDVAVAIALRSPVRLATVRRWSIAEGFTAGFAEFLREVRRARVGRRRRSKPSPRRKGR